MSEVCCSPIASKLLLLLWIIR